MSKVERVGLMLWWVVAMALAYHVESFIMIFNAYIPAYMAWPSGFVMAVDKIRMGRWRCKLSAINFLITFPFRARITDGYN